MAKKKQRHDGPQEQVDKPLRPSKLPPIVPPVQLTDPEIAYRFNTKIRFGKVSAEQFCKDPDRRRELGYPVIISEVD